MTTASAPGKIILFGEHAVVYNRPALAVPVTQVHADVEVSASQRPGVWINAPDISLNSNLLALPPGDALRSAVEAVFRALDVNSHPALNIRVTSTIPVASGLGSGAAVSVALIRALSAHLGESLDDQHVNSLCYEIEKIHHGTPSGIDNTVITYACPVYFVKNQPVETFRVNSPFILIIADSGIRAPTRESVGDVRKLWEADPATWERVFDEVGEIVLQARQAIETGRWLDLGPLMDANQALLQKMSVSSAELDHLVVAAKTAGAEGAKLSGGGRGGNLIALVRPENAKKTAAALLAAGAVHTITTIIQ
ncbi:MAG TPA: mevalonate kinase [Anaerolineales bacterium]|jgi:mevalonate kinase